MSGGASRSYGREEEREGSLPRQTRLRRGRRRRFRFSSLAQLSWHRLRARFGHLSARGDDDGRHDETKEEKRSFRCGRRARDPLLVRDGQADTVRTTRSPVEIERNGTKPRHHLALAASTHLPPLLRVSTAQAPPRGTKLAWVGFHALSSVSRTMLNDPDRGAHQWVGLRQHARVRVRGQQQPGIRRRARGGRSAPGSSAETREEVAPNRPRPRRQGQRP